MSTQISVEQGLLLENQICFPFYAASRLIVQAYQPFLDEMNITYPQYLVLLVLWEKDSRSVKEIGDLLLLDSGTLTPVMKKLFANGFIDRVRDENDDRIVLNRLTIKGKKLKGKAAGMGPYLFCKSGLNLKQAQDLKTSVHDLLSRLLRMNLN